MDSYVQIGETPWDSDRPNQPVYTKLTPSLMMALNWQPIDTAPKDMRPILVFVRANREPIQEEPDTIHVAFLKRTDTYALQDDDHSLIDPTHWMPLPAAPKLP